MSTPESFDQMDQYIRAQAVDTVIWFLIHLFRIDRNPSTAMAAALRLRDLMQQLESLHHSQAEPGSVTEVH
ncbi:hypothetical protein [Rhodoferax mekongensis]|uniref:hypothetical protein n=1 Tax=Rhodoferax mekongensis TaxID=3068341 RepID=UPI0028BE22CE|nr:hypothetical protein [Rhodoferax sp. TBRC 17199]MDT7514679.1 hypothetical protein [Rhodoferax sp. TBRC 17199]